MSTGDPQNSALKVYLDDVIGVIPNGSFGTIGLSEENVIEKNKELLYKMMYNCFSLMQSVSEELKTGNISDETIERAKIQTKFCPDQDEQMRLEFLQYLKKHFEDNKGK